MRTWKHSSMKFLISTLDVARWSVSRPSRFIHRGRAFSVSHRQSRRCEDKNLLTLRESKTGSLTVQPLGYLLYLLSYRGFLSNVSIELFLLAGRTDSSPQTQMPGSGSHFKRAQYTSNVQILFSLSFFSIPA